MNLYEKIEDKIEESKRLGENFVGVCSMKDMVFYVVTTPEKLARDAESGRYEVHAIVRDYGQTICRNVVIKEGTILFTFAHSPAYSELGHQR